MCRITISLANHRRIGGRRLSERARDIMRHYGVFGCEQREAGPGARVSIDVSPGRLTLIGGPSGAGKSTALRRIAARCGRAEWIRPGELAGPHGCQRVVDSLDAGASQQDTFAMLAACGLGEPRLWLRPIHALSDGERFRAALARGVLLAQRSTPPLVLLCDEFAVSLHTRLARAVAMNIRRVVTRYGLAIVLATVRDDLLDVLRPDAFIRLPVVGPSPSRQPLATAGSAQATAVRHATTFGPCPLESANNRTTPNRTACSPADSSPVSLTISRGCSADYMALAAMHYRGARMPRFVDQVFALRDTTGGEPLGALLLCYPPLELALRNQATADRFRGNVDRLNREMRIIRRVIVHPDVRGCGLGTRLVRHALEHAGTRFVECLAALGAVCPVFERAGMMRVGQCGVPRGRVRLLQRLELWNIDPADTRIDARLRDCPRLQQLLARTLAERSRAVHSAGMGRHAPRPNALREAVMRLFGSPPTYFLWDAESPAQHSTQGVET